MTNKLDAPLAIEAVDDLTVAEGVASGTEVVQLSHSINEVGVDVTYRLVVEHDHFALSSNGRLTIKTPIDYEALSQDEKENGIALQIIARATRDGEELLKATLGDPDRSRVTNKLDAPLAIDAVDDLTVAEGVASGTEVVQLSHSINEVGVDVTYRLVVEHDHFALSSNGHLTIKTPIDYETLSQDEKENGIALQIIARATRDGEELLKATLGDPDRSRVTNKLDAPLAIDAVDDLTVAEGVASGTEVVQLSHSINEVGVDVTYRLVVEHDHFALSSNGRLTIKTPIDYEALSDAEKVNGITLQIIARASRGEEQTS